MIVTPEHCVAIGKRLAGPGYEKTWVIWIAKPTSQDTLEIFDAFEKTAMHHGSFGRPISLEPGTVAFHAGSMAGSDPKMLRQHLKSLL